MIALCDSTPNISPFKTTKHSRVHQYYSAGEKVLRKSGIREGMILVSAMHITAGVWVNDAEDGLLADIDEWLEKLAPFRARLPPPPHRRNQRRFPPEEPAGAPRSDRAGHRRASSISARGSRSITPSSTASVPNASSLKRWASSPAERPNRRSRHSPVGDHMNASHSSLSFSDRRARAARPNFPSSRWCCTSTASATSSAPAASPPANPRASISTRRR